MLIQIVFKETAVWTHETKPLSRDWQICWFRIIQEFMWIWNTRNRTSTSFKWLFPLAGIMWKIKCFTDTDIGSLAGWWILEGMISRRYQIAWMNLLKYFFSLVTQNTKFLKTFEIWFCTKFFLRKTHHWSQVRLEILSII